MVASNEVIDADVAVLGAGPAGAAAALHLAQRGVERVVLVDRADFPRDKTCGSGVSPKGIACLRTLGVWEAIEPHAYRIKGLRLVTPGDRDVKLSGGDSVDAVICNRRVLDEILLRRGESLGVRFVPDFVARTLREENGRVTGFRAADGREVRARYTVVADGAHSRFVVERGPKQLLQAIMGWWDGVPFTPHHVEMVFDPMVRPHYGWLFPESATRVNIGICYREGPGRENARDLFQRFLDRQYGERLRGATPVGGWKGHPILYSFAIDALWSPGRIVTGEAGRMTHPATGEGIYHGLHTGVLAADALADVLAGRSTEAVAFGRYQAQCRRAFLASFWSAKVFERVISSPVVDWVADVGQRPAIKRAAGRLMAQM